MTSEDIILDFSVCTSGGQAYVSDHLITVQVQVNMGVMNMMIMMLYLCNICLWMFSMF